MKPHVDLYSGTYKHYSAEPYGDIRKETYGEDIGQTSWLTVDEYRNFFKRLKLSTDKKVLEIATGSGGPAVFMVEETGCHLTGIDINEEGIINAKKLAHENGLSDRMEFLLGDASERLPFNDDSFDVLISMDSINHLKDRDQYFHEFYRVLKKGGQILFTDPVVITGMITNEEIAERSSLGFFLFVPSGENERLLKAAGFQNIQVSDVTENEAMVSIKWHDARQKRKEALLKFEEENNFNGLQAFLKMVNLLSNQRRLSRIMYLAVK